MRINISSAIFFVLISLFPQFTQAAFSSRVLDLKVLNRLETKEKVVALTFDADMTERMNGELRSGQVATWYNKSLIEYLIREKVPATLFLTGMWIESYPEVTKSLSQNSLFELGNHSYSHPGFTTGCYNLPKVSKDKKVEEIEKTDKLLQKYAPSYKKYFRFPGLCFYKNDLLLVEQYGYRVVHGNVISHDGFENNADKIVRNVLDNVRPGSIVIMHMNGSATSPKTEEAVEVIVRKLREEGYKFVKVSELLGGELK